MASASPANWLDAYPVVPQAPAAAPGRTTLTPLAPRRQDPAPSGYRYGPDGNLQAIPGGPADPDRNNHGPSGDVNQTGPAYIATIPDTSRRAQVQAMLEGRIPYPTGRALTDPHWQQLVSDVVQADPTYDANTSAMRRQAMTQFTGNGTAAQRIGSANRLAAHLDDLNNASSALVGPDTGISPLNSALATVGQWGEPQAATRYDNAVGQVAGELERYFRGAGGSSGDIDRIISNLSRRQSLTTRQAAIREVVSLIHGGMQPLMDQYNSAFLPGTSRPAIPWIDRNAEDVYRRLGGIDMSRGDEGTPRPGGYTAEDVAASVQSAALARPTDSPPPNPPEGGGIPPPNFSGPGSPPPPGGQGPTLGLGNEAGALTHGMAQQQGQIEFGGSGTPPSPWEAAQIARYDQFMRDNPRATAEQLQAAFPRIGNAAEIVAARDRGAGVQPGRNYRLSSDVDAEHAAAAERAAADARVASMTPLERFADQTNPGNHPFDAALRMATGRGPLASGDEGSAAVDRGVGDTLSLGFRDELNGGLRTLSQGGNRDDNISFERALDRYDWANHPILRLGGEVAGGAVLPVGEAPTVGRLALLGAGYGAAHGLGSGEGAVDRLERAGTEGAIGALAGAAGGFAANRLSALGQARSAARASADSVDASQVGAAATSQGIDILPADAGGGITRALTAGAAQSPVAGGIIRSAAQRTANQFAGRVGEIAASEGTPVRQEVLGDTLTGALDRANNSVRSSTDNAYTAARAAEGGQQYIGMEAVRKIDQHIDELAGNPSTNAPLIAGLERLRSDLAHPEGGGLTLKTIDDMRQLRTSTASEARTEGLRGTDYQRRANDVLDGLREDIAADLPPEAAAQFRAADLAHKERLSFIDDVQTRLMGPQGDRSAEGVTQRLMSMTRGDSGRFGRVLDQVSPEEAGTIRASVIQEMGRPPPGTPGDFSVATWARNYRALPERTRDLLFRGENAGHANDLLTIADGIEGTSRLRNSSNTTGATAALQLIRTLGSGAAGYATYGGSTAAEGLAGLVLSSPRLARLLARPPAESGTFIRRLTQIAVRNPELQPQVNILRSALEGGTRSAAAQDGTDQPR